jgi:hypothetical protein
MSPQQVFSIANAVALLAWIMLAVLPSQPWVRRTITTKIIPALFAVPYTVIAGSLFWRSSGGFSSLADVATLFSNPWLLLAGWVHYLAFDLLMGSWEVEDARQRGIPHLMVVPWRVFLSPANDMARVLLLTFLSGPAGWLLDTILRSIRRTDSK